MEINDFALEEGLWTTVCAEGNADLFDFNEVSGNIAFVNGAAAEEDMWLNMYALYNVNVMGDYVVEATFTPTGEANEMGAERTYGLVAWYQDSDNFLIYWLQQKPGGDWSGQFYGKVDGVIRSFVTDPAATEWNNNEWNDMWWDGPTAHPEIRGESQILLSAEVTLRIVSTVVELDELGTVRAFELHQIVNGVDHVADTYYIKDAVDAEGEILTGIYVNNFDVAVQFN